MQTIQIYQLKDFVGQEVKLRGWVRNWRKQSSKLRFVVLRDGTGEVQCVAHKPDMGEEAFEAVKALSIETSLEVWGTVGRHPRREGVFEIALKRVVPMQVAVDYPIGKKEHGPDFLLGQRHLWLRSSRQWAQLRIRHTVYSAIEGFLNGQGFIRFDSPILTPSSCEDTTTLFEVPYFDMGSAYLSQSGQLYLEAGIMSLRRVYDFGPVFRAEKSKTRKHLTEFWMMDAEAAFVEHEENMQIQEDLIRHIIRTVLERCATELETLERDTDTLRRADAPFPRWTHRQAIDYLKSKGCDIDYSDDFGAAEEEMLTAESDTPVFIERWPAEIKAFYMRRDPESPGLALCSDLLAPEGFGEIIGGSERETDHDELQSRMKSLGMPMDEYQWYLDLRKYGSVPHSGFGIGLERTVGWMAGSRHVRECIPFPRMISRVTP
ncbi:MAG: asparagine--tRNA ligase [Candidatus Cloacimonetes bacterium]|nr:asparagine--tRNA ligase [Candidatus Cloacimonadota bacterium]